MSSLPSDLAKSISELAAQLVRIPSRGGEDSPEPIVAKIKDWLMSHGLQPTILFSESGKTVGLYVGIRCGTENQAICLNACIDTAPYGEESRWRFPPASGTIDSGKLYGRGAADSKMAAAIFSHLAAAFS